MMDPRRIVQLERDIAQLKADMRSMRGVGGSASRRQPRVAKTVDDYYSSPMYPPTPTPPVVDPETGAVTPGDPHPNTFPFVFVDAIHDEVAGILTPTSTNRQRVTPLAGKTIYGHVHNLCGVFIPKNTLIEVFEDNGKFWTSWNGTIYSANGTTEPKNDGYMNAVSLAISETNRSHTTLETTTTLEWDVAFPSTAALEPFGLEWDVANNKLSVIGDDDIGVWIVGNGTFYKETSSGLPTDGLMYCQYQFQGYNATTDASSGSGVTAYMHWVNSTVATGWAYRVSGAVAQYKLLKADEYYRLNVISRGQNTTFNGTTFRGGYWLTLFRYFPPASE